MAERFILGMVWIGSIHRGRVTPICVNELTIIGSDNGLSPVRRQAIIWNKAGIMLIGNKLLSNINQINTFPFKKMHLEMQSVKKRVNVAKQFACTSIIKFPPAWFAKNPFWSHTNLTMDQSSMGFDINSYIPFIPVNYFLSYTCLTIA